MDPKLIQRYEALTGLIQGIDQRLMSIDAEGIQTHSIPPRLANKILPIPWHRYFVSETNDVITSAIEIKDDGSVQEVIMAGDQSRPPIDELAILEIDPLTRLKRIVSSVTKFAAMPKSITNLSHPPSNTKMKARQRTHRILKLVLDDEQTTQEASESTLHLSVFSFLPRALQSHFESLSKKQEVNFSKCLLSDATLSQSPKTQNTTEETREKFEDSTPDDENSTLSHSKPSEPKVIWARCCKEVLLFDAVMKQTFSCVATEHVARECGIRMMGGSLVAELGATQSPNAVLQQLGKLFSPMVQESFPKVLTSYTEHALRHHHHLVLQLAKSSQIDGNIQTSNGSDPKKNSLPPCSLSPSNRGGLFYRLPMPIMALGCRLMQISQSSTMSILPSEQLKGGGDAKALLVSKVKVSGSRSSPLPTHISSLNKLSIESLLQMSPSLSSAFQELSLPHESQGSKNPAQSLFPLLWLKLSAPKAIPRTTALGSKAGGSSAAAITRQNAKTMTWLCEALSTFFSSGSMHTFDVALSLQHFYSGVAVPFSTFSSTGFGATMLAKTTFLNFTRQYCSTWHIVPTSPEAANADSISHLLVSSLGTRESATATTHSISSSISTHQILHLITPKTGPINPLPCDLYCNAHFNSLSISNFISADRVYPIQADMEAYLRARKEAAQQARLRALRSSDADAYMAHLSDVKVSSLLKIMETTHKFMLKVGAQISQKGVEEEQAAKNDTGNTAHNAVVEAVLHQHHKSEGTAVVSNERDDPLAASSNYDYQRFREYVRSTKDEYKLVHKVEAFVGTQPVGLQATLMPHQLVGLRFLVSLHANGINGILADEMGVGKTIQTISFLLHLKEERMRMAGIAPVVADGVELEDLMKNKDDDVKVPNQHAQTSSKRFVVPNLVLAPLSIIREWRDACAQFVPKSIKVCELHELEEETDDDDEYDCNDEEEVTIAEFMGAHDATRRSVSDDSSDFESSSSSESSDEDSGSESDNCGRRRGSKKKKAIDFDKYYDRQKAKKAKTQKKKGSCNQKASSRPKRQNASTKPKRTSWERAMDYDIVLLALHRTKDMSRELRSQVPWGYIVVDEAHKAVSNLGTITAQAISAIKFKRRLVLTGTPLNNDLQELWSLLHFINPDIFSAQDSFEEVFRKPFQATDTSGSGSRSGVKTKLVGVVGANNPSEKTPEELQEDRLRAIEEQRFQKQLAQDTQLKEEEKQLLIMRMHQILRPFMLRRTKKDIDTSLKITFHEVKCPLTVIQRGLLKLLREHKSLPYVIAEPKRNFSDRHYSNSTGPNASEARRALMLSDLGMYRQSTKNGETYSNNDAPLVQANMPKHSKRLRSLKDAEEKTKCVNHSLLLNPYTGYIDDSATDSDTDIEELPKSIAAQRLLAAARPIKRYPHNPIIYSTCQLRSTTTITTTAQTICNHPFMIPFFSRVLMRETERQIARVINVYRKIRKVSESARIKREESERKKAIAAEKRRQTILLKKQLAVTEDEANCPDINQPVDQSHEDSDPTVNETDFRENIIKDLPLQIAEEDSPLKAAPDQKPMPPPPPHPFQTQKEDEVKLRRLVISLLEGQPVPSDLSDDPLVRKVLTAASKSTEHDKDARPKEKRTEKKGKKSTPENDSDSTPTTDDPRHHPLTYPFESFNISAMKSAELTLSCSGKFIVLDMILRRLKLLNKKVVIFSHWLDCIDLLSEYLDGCGWKGQHVALTGSASADERKAAVDQFRTDPNMLVFIVSVKAGGCGLNLQVANIVIMLDRDYTATNEDQAIARVFRIGQKNTVRAISLCTDDVAEARILAISDKKNKPREALIEGGGYNIGTTDSDRQKAVAQSMKNRRPMHNKDDKDDEEADRNETAQTEELEVLDEVEAEGAKDAFIDLTDLETLVPSLMVINKEKLSSEMVKRPSKKRNQFPELKESIESAIPAFQVTAEMFNAISFSSCTSKGVSTDSKALSARLHHLTHAFDRILLAESDYDVSTGEVAGCPALEALQRSGITYRPLYQHVDWSLGIQSAAGEGSQTTSADILCRVPNVIAKAFVECAVNLEQSVNSGRSRRGNNQDVDARKSGTNDLSKTNQRSKVCQSSWLTSLLESVALPSKIVPLHVGDFSAGTKCSANHGENLPESATHNRADTSCRGPLPSKDPISEMCIPVGNTNTKLTTSIESGTPFTPVKDGHMSPFSEHFSSSSPTQLSTVGFSDFSKSNSDTTVREQRGEACSDLFTDLSVVALSYD